MAPGALISVRRLLVIVIVIFYIIIDAGEGYEKGNRRRFIAVLRLECVMGLLSVLMYDQLMEWFEESLRHAKGFHEKRNIKSQEQKCSLALLFLIFMAHFLYFEFYITLPLQRLIFDTATICGGVWTNLIAFTGGFAIMNFVLRILMKIGPLRKFLRLFDEVRWIHAVLWQRKVQIIICLSAALILSVPMYISSGMVVTKEKVIEIDVLLSLICRTIDHVQNFTATRKELRFTVISDVHAGASVHRKQTLRVVEEIMKAHSDAVFIVGDMVDGPVEALLESHIEPFSVLAKFVPTFFVTGNHEYYYGNAQEWLDVYRKFGFNVLENSNKMMNGVCIAGVNDISSSKTGIVNHNMNLTEALDGCEDGKTRILLAHNPVSVLEFHKDDLQTVSLVVSGHTHAGQFYVMVPLVYFMFPYIYGLHKISEFTQLFITAGTLYQGPPMKMIGMSEIWTLRLVPKQ